MMGAWGQAAGDDSALARAFFCMGKVSHFRDLRVWQGGMDTVVEVYRVSGRFPKAEMYGLTGQLRRAAVSGPSNFGKGRTWASTKEYLNHVSIAQAPFAEMETQLEIATRLGYIEAADLEPLLQQSSCLGKPLYVLRDALVKKL